MEEYLDNTQDMENLYMAIKNLPEVQKRRLKKYYFEDKTFDKIALEEGCTYQCVQRSVYRAVEKIKLTGGLLLLYNNKVLSAFNAKKSIKMPTGNSIKS